MNNEDQERGIYTTVAKEAGKWWLPFFLSILAFDAWLLWKCLH